MISPLYRRGWLALGAIALLTVPSEIDAQSPVLPALTAKQRSNAEAAYLSGARHLRDAEFQQAEQDFSKAVVLDPVKPEYLSALALAREHRVTDLLQQSAQRRGSDPVAADALLQQARAIDGTNPRITQRDAPAPAAVTAPVAAPLRRTEIAGAISLQPNGSTHSYHDRNDIRALATRFAADYGLRAVLDPDLDTKQFRIDVDDVKFADALNVFTQTTGTMSVPLDEHTVLFAADTIANRQRYERLVEETYYLPGYTADQMKDFVSIAQNLLSIKQVSVQPGLGVLVMRGPAEQVQAAERVFDDLLQGDSDVVVDMKLYAVDKQRIRNLGVTLPSSFTAYDVRAAAQSLVNSNQTLVQQLISSGAVSSTASVEELALFLAVSGVLGTSGALFTNSFLTFGGGISRGALSGSTALALNLALSQSDARTLDDLQLRASDRQTVTFKAGTRYPIQTSLFSDIASSTTSSLAGLTVNGVSLSSLLSSYLGTSSLSSSAVIPQIQYEDLGLVVTAVPRVLRTSDVGMHLEVKVTALAGASLNGIPILASRQFSSDLTLSDGQSAMMISNASESEIGAVTGLPGLGEIPGFQSTTNKSSTKITSDLILLITPHIVRHGHTQMKGPYIPLPQRPDDD